MKKLLPILLVFSLLFGVAMQVCAEDMNIVINNITVDGDNVTIQGESTDHTIPIVCEVRDTKDKLTYIWYDYCNSQKQFAFHFTMPSRATSGTYIATVTMYGYDVIQTGTFSYTKAVTSPDQNGQPSDIKLVINNEQVTFPDQQPILFDGRTYVPVRFLAEGLGARVEWDEEHQVIIITNCGIQYTDFESSYARYYLRIGEPQMVYVQYATHDNYPSEIQIFDIPQAPFLTESGRTMLPFRFVSELLGAFIYYDATTNTAIAEYDAENKFQTAQPIPILSTVVQDAFYYELMDFRLKNQPDHVKNPGLMNIETRDELISAATWKTLQLFEKYDHQNPDGTMYWGRFFSLYLPNTEYSFNGENIKSSKFSAPLGIFMINAADHSSGHYADQYYYCIQDVDAWLDDSEYWYFHLADDWGIHMVPLTETSDLVYKGKSYAKYKMNSEHYLKVSGVNFHSFSIIEHWTEETYRSYMRQEVRSWGNSFGHRAVLQTTQGKFGYGVRLIEGQGYATYAKGY
ncbi:MAG: copper amine oxidase N-terminal domain-containing protein [Clostridia bacterium]|nr:copper amine oxidase N-terminal domain-containing protein [Clostridia bacterium]